jgi:hypothetical protein
MALRGPEYLPHSKNASSKHHSTPRSPEPSSATSEDFLKEATESVFDKEKRTMRGLKKPPSASSPSLRTLGQDRQPQRMPSYIPTYNSKSKSFLPLPTEDRERDREKVLEREKSREKLDRDAQFSKKWEDHLGFSITRSGRDKSKNRDRDNSRSLRENTFIPTSREEAEQAGMKVICINFRVQPNTAAGERDNKADGAFPKTRRYTSTGPSLALLAGGMKVKMKTTTTGQHVVIDSGAYTGEPSMEDFGGPTVTTTTAGTGSQVSHPTSFVWGFFGSVRVDDRERKTTERRKAANDYLGPLPPPPRPGIRSTEFGGEIDEAGYAVIIPERSDSISPSLLTTARPTVVVPTLTSTTTSATTSPKSQPEHEILIDSDSSSSISVSSLVFAHTSPYESDLDDESFKPRGGAASALSGVSYRPRKGYRHGGYVQAQMKKTKNEGAGDRRGVANAAEVNSKLGDAGHPQRNKDEERDGWIALDMVNDNGSFKFSFLCVCIHEFF